MYNIVRETTPAQATAIALAAEAGRRSRQAAAEYKQAVIAAKATGATNIAIAQGIGVSAENIRKMLNRADTKTISE
jgi:hypothetical protein